MRKLSGFVIAVAAFVFLGLAYAQLAHAEEPDCESALAAKLVELSKGEGNMKILSLQLEITALKLARETVEGGAGTIEQSVRKQQAVLDKLDDKGVRDQLKALYMRYGQTEDQAKIQEAIDAVGETSGKAKKANYYKRSLRFKNRDLSAYVYLKAHTEEKPFFSDIDASILWYQSEISEGIEEKSYRGSAAANLQEVSTKVAHLLGVTGTTPKTASELDQLIADHEEVLGQAFDKIQADYAEELKKSCAEMKTCTECAVTDAKNRISDEHRAKAMKKAITAIVVEMQKNAPAREAAINKVADELKAKGIKVERLPEENTSTAGANTASANTAGANTAGANTAGTNTAGTNTAGANTAGANTLGNVTSSTDTAHHDNAAWTFNSADTNKVNANGADTNKLKLGVDTNTVKLRVDTVKTNTALSSSLGAASTIGASPQVLPKVKVASAELLERNKEKVLSQIRSGFSSPMPLGSSLLGGTPKKLTVPPPIGNCLTAYYLDGTKVVFRISSKNLATVCEGSYVSTSLMLQNQWNPDRALETCKLGEMGVDAKSICDQLK